MSKGSVIESTGSWYKVLDSSGEVYNCRMRGRLRLRGVRSTNPIVVGDVVEFEVSDDGGGAITGIDERKNYIIRRSSNLSKESHIIAANIDRAMVVVSLSAPRTNTEFLDRFLITCEAYKIPAIIILNKIDLMQDNMSEVDDFVDIYNLAGYQVIKCCAHSGEGLDEVKALLVKSTTLLSGNSGVGKSTIIKAIEPTAEVKIGKVSDSHHKGKHTTTFSHTYPLSDGGYIIDTPGIKGFGLIDIAPEELWHYFPEFMHFGQECQYYNCTHIHEPGCAVVEAITDGKISASRYESYMKILNEDGKYR